MSDTPIPLPAPSISALADIQIIHGPEAEALALLKAKEEAATEFTCFPDGALAKWFPRPGFAPQVLLVDATGAQLGVLRNPDIGELVCNAMNLLVIASRVKEEQEKKMIAPPTSIITPTVYES